MSMISEQVKKLRKLANQWKHNDVAGCNLIFEACDTIEALSAKVRAEDKSTGEWIPVSERLPKVGEDVLFSIDTMYVSEGCLRDDGDWWQFRWNSVQPKKYVIAWMPLPEPYREGGEA